MPRMMSTMIVLQILMAAAILLPNCAVAQTVVEARFDGMNGGSRVPAINPSFDLPSSRPLSGLDQQEVESYRSNLQGRIQELHQSGGDMTPRGNIATDHLQGEVNRLNDALTAH